MILWYGRGNFVQMDFWSFSWCIGACRSTYLHQNPGFTKFARPYHSQWYSEQYYLRQTSCIYYICGNVGDIVSKNSFWRYKNTHMSNQLKTHTVPLAQPRRQNPWSEEHRNFTHVPKQVSARGWCFFVTRLDSWRKRARTMIKPQVVVTSRNASCRTCR